MTTTQSWWFGAFIGIALVSAITATAITMGVSLEAGGVEVSLGVDASTGLQLRFATIG